MIIDKLVMSDFGVFGGNHEIILTPPTAKKPVIVFGGLNGRGKTTLLDAIQLALYGKFAQCSKRGSQAYREFQKSCIHKGAFTSAVELQFRSTSEGKEESFSVRRSWNAAPTSTEKVEVFRDQIRDQVLEETWDEYVERFLPVGIAPLFFFDGEKIEQLADPETSASMLNSAVNALLGLDMIQRLLVDLTTIERKKRSELSDDPDNEALDELEEKIARLSLALDKRKVETADAVSALREAKKQAEESDSAFRAQGGELYQKRLEIEALVRSTEASLGITKNSLLDLAEGSAPLLLVKPMIAGIIEDDQNEQSDADNEILGALLENRDEEALAFFSEIVEGPSGQAAQLREFFDEDRRKRTAVSSAESFLFLSQETRSFLHSLASDLGPRIQAEISSLLANENEAQGELTVLERKKSTMPTQDSITDLIRKRDEKRKKVHVDETQLLMLQQADERVERELEETSAKRLKILEKDVAYRFSQDGVGRTIEHSKRTRAVLKRFAAELTRKNASQIGSLVLESFQALIGKEKFVTGISIDPDSMAVTLSGEGGEGIPSEYLSAGERQLLAVALLWGLARFSGRSLPTVIDTPLGRLDSSHRTNLVQRYFPNASHQVILLSTDEELNETYYPMLKHAVGRTYLIEYDEKTRSSRVKNEFFW